MAGRSGSAGVAWVTGERWFEKEGHSGRGQRGYGGVHGVSGGGTGARVSLRREGLQ